MPDEKTSAFRHIRSPDCAQCPIKLVPGFHTGLSFMRCVPVVLLLATALPAFAADFALQLPGGFHGDETVARDGELWLALRVNDSQAELVANRISVTPFEDPVVDAMGERSGRMVATTGTDSDADTLALLHGAGLTAGPVIAAETGDIALAIGETVVLQAPGLDELALRVDCHELEPAQDDRLRCVLSAYGQRMQQELHVFDATRGSAGNVLLGDDGGARLRFAGDLDRDGRLDLILDVSDHYNVVYPTLLLSRGAGDGALLRAEAVQQISGC
jgi:hypothetical protein